MTADDLRLLHDRMQLITVRQIAAIAVLTLAAFFVVNEARAEPNKVQYELAERCGNEAAEQFRTQYKTNKDSSITNTKEGQTISGYRNHYDPTLNKCFIIIQSSIESYRATPPYSATMYLLYDLNDHKEYGQFYQRSDAKSPTACTVNGKFCESEAGWNSLIAPYMGDGR